jgi:uncharacterized sodium:solute symporter family permease YidK
LIRIVPQWFQSHLAVVAGIVVTGATSFSHDFYNEILKDGKATEKQQMFMVRLSSIIITIVSIIISLSLQSLKWAGMCGEMAGDEVAIPILLGLGLDEFSMSATSILKTKSQCFSFQKLNAT